MYIIEFNIEYNAYTKPRTFLNLGFRHASANNVQKLLNEYFEKGAVDAHMDKLQCGEQVAFKIEDGAANVRINVEHIVIITSILEEELNITAMLQGVQDIEVSQPPQHAFSDIA